ncbi:Capping protein; Arp2/3 and myosin-I linker protein 3 [Camelus dromedarius]|uniref:Capping protein n=1 Tax=Camelus dromedarius TaxID=9838 RepID=A0A5N4E479_CAMDR|nr:Capping protein; Arp2/3 and myosin-I linker protein 3 [Camelus dromedarius]
MTLASPSVILESMVSLTQELCPVAMRVAEGHNKMLSNVAERVTVPRNFIRGALLEQAGQDIQNKLDEVKLSVVTYLTNSIVDEILQELYHSHKSLARHLAQLRTLSDPPGGPGQGQDLSSRGRGQNHDHEETTDDELGTNIDTMAIKKQKRCRKIRPVSAFIRLSFQQVPVPGTRQENGMATRLDEGLEDFFSRRVMDESSRCDAQGHPQFQQALRPWKGSCGTGPDLEGSVQAWQKRRSSDDAGPGAWKPPPPPQSTKPSFSAMRRAEATWHIAEESAPNHSCQSPSPACQDGEEEKDGAIFPERTVSARNAKVRASRAVGKTLPTLIVISGPPDPGRRTAPLKPKRTRRAQSCDKLEPDRRRPPDPTAGTSEPGTD